jgi:hypothetical protein
MHRIAPGLGAYRRVHNEPLSRTRRHHGDVQKQQPRQRVYGQVDLARGGTRRRLEQQKALHLRAHP